MLCDRAQAGMGILSPRTAPVHYKCVCVHTTSLLPAPLLPGISSSRAPAAFFPRVTCGLRATRCSCSSLCWHKGEWRLPATFFNLSFGLSPWDHHVEILDTHPETVPMPQEPFLEASGIWATGLIWVAVGEEGTEIKVTPSPLLRGGPQPEAGLCAPAWGVAGEHPHAARQAGTTTRAPTPASSACQGRCSVFTRHKSSAKADGSRSRCRRFGAARTWAGTRGSCCYSLSHTRWQPVLLAGLFTLAPFATTKAENISHNFCLLFSAEESWFIFIAAFHLEKHLPVCVMFLQWQRNTCPPSLRSRGEMWLWRNAARRIWRHALCWFI